ncbi:metal-dependent hydrolases of the beta-lactamase superfamily I [Filimonas lacunae]|nr:metal-dependent hydrolases of the beta-lactamase superfamily I [Filimonas lacunae]
MLRLGLSLNKVKAVFISHEHSDHIRGLPVLSRKYNLPVYITDGTLHHGGLKDQVRTVLSFTADESVLIGDLEVMPFSKQHDAADPHSFTISCNDTRIGVFTDIGISCPNLVKHFQQCHAAFLEANYDETMLAESRYPYFLKKRISGGRGHLSNKQALELFTTHRPAYMSHLLLAHLSQENNKPELVQDLFNSCAGQTTITVASRHQESAVYRITGTQ